MDYEYDSQFSNVNFSGKNYTITDLIPRLDSEDEQKICREINGKLTQILEKYI